jgi:hypothetical protein
MTAKADRVRELLNNPDLQEALADIREMYRDRVEDPSLSNEQVLQVRDLLLLLQMFEQTLANAVESGDFEDFKATEQERMDEWNRTLQ